MTTIVTYYVDGDGGHWRACWTRDSEVRPKILPDIASPTAAPEIVRAVARTASAPIPIDVIHPYEPTMLLRLYADLDCYYRRAQGDARMRIYDCMRDIEDWLGAHIATEEDHED